MLVIQSMLQITLHQPRQHQQRLDKIMNLAFEPLTLQDERTPLRRPPSNSTSTSTSTNNGGSMSAMDQLLERMNSSLHLQSYFNVRFQDDVTIIPVESTESYSDEEIAQIWHTENDIESYKENARKLSDKIKAGTIPDEELRGLELRSSLVRQQRKVMTIQAILKVQKRCKDDPEKLAGVAKKCSAWAIAAANVEGQRDFVEIHSPTDALLLNPELPDMADYPMPFKNKFNHTRRSPVVGELMTKFNKRPLSPVPGRCVRRRSDPGLASTISLFAATQQQQELTTTTTFLYANAK